MALPAGNYSLDNQSMSSSSAQGGHISNGMINNSAGSSFGLVKTLALCGFALILLRFLK